MLLIEARVTHYAPLVRAELRREGFLPDDIRRGVQGEEVCVGCLEI